MNRLWILLRTPPRRHKTEVVMPRLGLLLLMFAAGFASAPAFAEGTDATASATAQLCLRTSPKGASW